MGPMAPARRGETRGRGRPAGEDAHANEHSTCYGAQHQPSHTQHDWLDSEDPPICSNDHPQCGEGSAHEA